MKKEDWIPLLEAWLAQEKKDLDSIDYPLSAKYDNEHDYLWLLQQMEETRDPSLLIPLLNLPDAVRPHFEDLLGRRFELRQRARQGRTLPSYMPMRQRDADLSFLAAGVRYLEAGGVPRKEALDIIDTWLSKRGARAWGHDYNREFNRDLLEAEVEGTRSSTRMLARRRKLKK